MEIEGNFINSLDTPFETEPEFRWKGCNNCGNGLGNNVFECKAYFNTFSDYYEIYLCSGCLCTYHNGDSLDDECRNIFRI